MGFSINEYWQYHYLIIQSKLDYSKIVINFLDLL